MIDFATVSREFGSLIHRRNQLLTFFGSVFAATGIFLHNVLRGQLPAALKGMSEHVFAFYALMLMVPTLILALRMARLHGGIIINGMLYARLLQEQTFTRKGDPERAGRHNWMSVSFLQFLLTDLLAGFAASILALALDASVTASVLVGAGVAVVWLALYFRFHHQAVTLARRMIASETCGPVNEKDWKAHVSNSLEEANAGLVSDLGFVGLIMFSAFEKLSSLGEITRENAGKAYDAVQGYGPWVYSILMVVTCVFGLVLYLRVRMAIGAFCLQLDPDDRPFRPLKLTDSLLGYLLMAFLFVVSLHTLLTVALPELPPPLLFACDGAALVLAVLLEQVTLVVAEAVQACVSSARFVRTGRLERLKQRGGKFPTCR